MHYLNPRQGGILNAAAIVVLAGVLHACGGSSSSSSSSSSSNGNGNGAGGGEIPTAFTSVEASNYGELQNALDDAAAEERDDLDDPDSVYRIDVTDDIDDGFDSSSHLNYSGDVDIHLRGESEMRTLNAGEHSRILDAGGSKLWVENLHFTNGFTEDVHEDGGAISASGDDTHIIDSRFTNNTAGENRSGGAIQVSSDIYIDNSVFKNNSSGRSGGSVGMFENYDAWITDSRFEDNKSLNTGGGAVRADEVTIENSEFINNRTEEDNNGGGGAVWTRKGGSIMDSKFTDNSSEVDGAAVHVGQGGATGIRIPLEVTGSEFKRNDARFRGSAIASVGEPEGDEEIFISLDDSLFEENEQGNLANHSVIAAYGEDEDIRSKDSSYINNDEDVLNSNEGDLIDEGGNDFEPSGHEPTWDG